MAAIGLLIGCSSSSDRDASGPSDSLAGKCASDNPYASVAPTADEQAQRPARRARLGRRLHGRGLPLVRRDPDGSIHAAPSYNVAPAQVSLQSWFEALKTPALTPRTRKDRFSFTLTTSQMECAGAEAGVVGGYGIEWTLGFADAPRARPGRLCRGRVRQAATAGLARGDALQRWRSTASTSISSTRPTGRDRAAQSRRSSPARDSRHHQAAATNRRRRRVAQRDPGREPRDDHAGEGCTEVLRSPWQRGRLPAVQRFHPAGRGAARGRRCSEFRDAGVSDLVARPALQRWRLPLHGKPARLHDRAAARTVGQDLRALDVQRQAAARTTAASSNMPFLPSAAASPGTGTVRRFAAAEPRVEPGLCADFGRHLLGQRIGHQRPARHRRGSDRAGRTAPAASPTASPRKDNCGLSYFPVEFQGVNARGFGDFADGFAADCPAGDDLARSLGDPSEEMLAAALHLITHGTCPSAGLGAIKASGSADGHLLRHVVREGMYLRRPQHW